jgi:type IV secretory pathway VirB4 component
VEELPNLLKIAENIVGLNGESKKSFVMNQIKLMISGTGITASEEDINSISTMIDSLVDLSKNINTAVNKHDINTVTGV